MKLNKEHKILIVGLGLLGGSYAKALSKHGYEVWAITRDQSSIDYALERGMISKGSAFVDEELCANADIVVFALYPHVFLEWIEQNQQLLKSGAILTDVTGVKSCIVEKIQASLRSDLEFIAAHPMAGREVSGVENSTEKMFSGANYIITPTEKNTESAIETATEIGHLLGFGNVAILSPEEHDEMIGFLSQLTHCIAVTLMTCNDAENMERFTGDSFRDLTRIAKINDLMWSELFLENKDVLLKQMDLFINKFNDLKDMLMRGDVDGMRAMMRHSTERRAKFEK